MIIDIYELLVFIYVQICLKNVCRSIEEFERLIKEFNLYKLLYILYINICLCYINIYKHV